MTHCNGDACTACRGGGDFPKNTTGKTYQGACVVRLSCLGDVAVYAQDDDAVARLHILYLHCFMGRHVKRRL
jgi:hypothetical protein